MESRRCLAVAFAVLVGCGRSSYTVIPPDASADTGVADARSPDAGPVSAALDVVIPVDARTSEAGAAVSVFVRLTARPSGDVSVPVASSDPGEGAVSASSVTFTTANWDGFQELVVTGVDDSDTDGAQSYLLRLGPSTSSDAAFAGLSRELPLTNTDDETAGVTLTSPSGDTSEAGGTATFTVVLDARPTADVTVALQSDDATEGTVSPSSLTFTVDNWDAPRTALVTGVDDAEADGLVTYTVSVASVTSADARYGGLSGIAPLTLRNEDDDTPGLVVAVPDGTTSEAGGEARVTVALRTTPTANVTVPVASDDPSEGTVGASSLVFTPANWDAPQTVVVTGQDDDVVDGAQTYGLVLGPATSTDPGYEGVTHAVVPLINVDDETAGATVSAPSGPTSEAGGRATLTVVLDSAPTADVRIMASVTDATEGTVAPAMLTFTSASWRAPQTLTVTGVDDDLADGAQVHAVRFAVASADPNYAAVTIRDVPITNVDDDTAGISVGAVAGTTTEAGGTATVSLRLDSRPSATVTVPYGSSDDTEGAPMGTAAVFTTSDWSAPHVISMRGVDDALADGDQPYDLVFGPATSADPAYEGLVAMRARFVNEDDDVPGIAVSAASRPTTEAGGTATFTVVLRTRPTADVTVRFATSDPTEGTTVRTSLTFTTANWSTPQTVTVTGVQDAVADGDQPYTIAFMPATSADAGYAGLTPPSVALVNVDDDSPGFLVSAVANTTESGIAISIGMVLTSEPTGPVTLSFAVSDPTEARLGVPSVTFERATWNQPQIVPVQGVDDFLDDGDVVYLITFSPAVSADPAYAGRRPGDLSIANIDNDTSDFIISPRDGVTTEGGGQYSFNVRLACEPTADVSVRLTSSDSSEGDVVAPVGARLTFTSLNWNSFQRFTVRGRDDVIPDGDVYYQVRLDGGGSADPLYAGIVRAANVVNLDDEAPSISVSDISNNTNERGRSATFVVQLSYEPTDVVELYLYSDNTAEGWPDTNYLYFDRSNWRDPQTVTVYGEDDGWRDEDQGYQIVFDPVSSPDPVYSGRRPMPVYVVNEDDEPYCRSANGVDWCFTPAECGTNCEEVCARNGMSPADDRMVFEAQDEEWECQEIANAFGTFLSRYEPTNQGYTYACVEDMWDESMHPSDLLCSSEPSCPTEHRYYSDSFGEGCTGMWSRRSICGCR
jgi:hypothetical protein